MTDPSQPAAGQEVVFNARQMGFHYEKSPWLFKDVSLTVRRSQVFSILGLNGCGKTTFLKILLGLLPPRAGSCAINGRAAFVPQFFDAAFSFTVMDMVLMGRAKHIGLFSRPGKRDVELALQTLEQFQVGHLAERLFNELSGGQRQLVMLARALVAEADILVLDEPTSSLDLSNQNMLLQWLIRLSKTLGITIIFTTHLPHHALQVADAALLMVDAASYHVGSAQDVLNEANLTKIYGIPLKRVRFEHEGKMAESIIPVFS
ncbi:MAG: ABC transporter ATP-binding protein [Deltaproteobacteria bacterium]|nr:ABC transporter ATP-binding protein [Deltaproteobacteria bacterium]